MGKPKTPASNVPNPIATPDKRPRQKRKFLSAEIGLLDQILGPIGAVLLAAGAVVYSDKRISGILIMVSGALCLFLVVSLHLRSRNTRNVPLAGALSKMIFGGAIVSLIVGVVSWSYFPFLKAVVGPFSISCGPSLLTPGRPLINSLMVEYPSKYGPTISPIHLMMTVTLVNLQSFPTMIDTYSLEGSADKTGSWLALFPISTVENRVYWAGNIKASRQIDMTTNGLDFELRGRQTGPHDSIRGWTLWECPYISGCVYPNMRFSVSDTAGTKAAAPCPFGSGSDKPEAEANMQYMKILPGLYDLSASHPAFMSEVMHGK